LILTGQGSTNDVTIKNDADADVAVIPTGTTNFGFNSGFGSASTAYGVRAWINFDGSGTISINASGGVSSLTDIANAAYQVNFATAMPDTNFAMCISTRIHGFDRTEIVARSTTSCQVGTFNVSGAGTEFDPVNVIFVR